MSEETPTPDPVTLTEEEKAIIRQIVEEFRGYVRRTLDLRAQLNEERLRAYGQQGKGRSLFFMAAGGFGPHLAKDIGLLKAPEDGSDDPVDFIGLNTSLSLGASSPDEMPAIITVEYPLQRLYHDFITLLRSLRYLGPRVIPFLIQYIHAVSAELLFVQLNTVKALNDAQVAAALEAMPSQGQA